MRAATAHQKLAAARASPTGYTGGTTMPDPLDRPVHRPGKLAAWCARSDVRWLLIFAGLDGGWLAGHFALGLVLALTIATVGALVGGREHRSARLRLTVEGVLVVACAASLMLVLRDTSAAQWSRAARLALILGVAGLAFVAGQVVSRRFSPR